jgi:hypothetical protein
MGNNSVNIDYFNKLIKFRNNIDDVIKAKELLEIVDTGDPLEMEDKRKRTVIDKMAFFKCDLARLRQISDNATKRIVKLTKRDRGIRAASLLYITSDQLEKIRKQVRKKWK